MLGRYETKWNKILDQIGGWPSPPFKSIGGWINWELNQWPEEDFDGFILNGSFNTYDQ
jgi:hypothetical protein